MEGMEEEERTCRELEQKESEGVDEGRGRKKKGKE